MLNNFCFILNLKIDFISLVIYIKMSGYQTKAGNQEKIKNLKNLKNLNFSGSQRLSDFQTFFYADVKAPPNPVQKQS